MIIDNFDESKKIFGKNLRTIRFEKNITINGLEEKSGVAQSQIRRYETGVNVPDMKSFVNLTRALGTTYEELLKGI